MILWISICEILNLSELNNVIYYIYIIILYLVIYGIEVVYLPVILSTVYWVRIVMYNKYKSTNC